MQDVKLLKMHAIDAWERALVDSYHPPLPDVHIEYEPESDAYFYIDTSNWRVHLNTAGVPTDIHVDDIEPYIRSVCHHEIQHYIDCPYDGVTAGFMFAAAKKIIGDDNVAMFISNLFADLVIDTKLLKRFRNLTKDRINRSIQHSADIYRNPSALWKLVVACYHKMMGFAIPANVIIEPKLRKAAAKITTITRRHMSYMNRWPLATKQIAQVLETESELLADAMQSRDIQVIMGDPAEARNGMKARRCIGDDNVWSEDTELESAIAEADNRGGDMLDIEGIAKVAGLNDDRTHWLKIYYRIKAKHTMKLEVTTERKDGGSVPLAPKVWRIGDPIEELDIIQSLQALPVLIPNVSTRSWESIGIQGQEVRETLPDLLIVLDSSGSMTWSQCQTNYSGDYHTALIGAFAAVELAFKRRCRIAVINFSDSYKVCDWTTDRRKVEETLMWYKGGGTTFPVDAISDLCSRESKPILILMITDAEVRNMQPLVKELKRQNGRGNKLIMIRIGKEDASSKIVMNKIAETGATVISTRTAKDLDGFIIRAVGGVYLREKVVPI